MLTPSMHASYQQNGFIVLQDFISPSTLGLIRKRAYSLASEIKRGKLPVVHPQGKTSWSLEDLKETTSSYCCHWEDLALKNSPSQKRLLKVSHALHRLDPVFKNLGQSLKIRHLVHSLGLTEPKIIQSMLHFKPPHSACAVDWHQDGTYIATKPCSTIGLWLALENATIENGCLRVIPTAHAQGLCTQLVRTDSGELTFKTLQKWDWPFELAIDLPVRAGTLIVLHGFLPHCSGENSSVHSRLSLTFHFIDLSSDYSERNWLPLEFI
jgi:phytanoyl-CoA hydroxylase